MRTINSAFRLAPPLLAAGCAALFGACAPGPDKTTNSAPTVNNIYAVDVDNGLPSVLIYSSTDPRVTPTPPQAYSAYQVEFNQPMNGGTLAPQAALVDSGAANLATTPATFCDGKGITLTDATGATIPSSVCYDPTSDIGGNPHVTIIPGAGGAATPSPFTCQSFTATSQGADASTNGSIPAGTYSLKFAPGIQSASGQGLTFPSTGGFSADKFTFTTAGLAIMAAGFNDPVSGYYSWFQKPFAGFMKDLNEAGKRGPNKDVASCSIDTDCQLTEQAAPGAPSGQFGQVCAAGVCSYRQQVATFGGAQTPTPFLIITSDLLNLAKSGEPVDKTGASTVTVTRADGTPFSATIGTMEPRVITVTPNGSWESGTAYTVTVGANLTASDGTTTTGTAKTFTFTAGTTDLAALSPPSPDENSTGNAIGTTVAVSYPVALDPSKLTGVQLLQGSTPVPLTPPVLDPTTGQIVTLTPSDPAGLAAGTVYTVSIKGVVAAPATGAAGVPTAPAALAGKPVKDYTYNFTTRNFNALSVKSGSTSLDRKFGVTPTVLQTGVKISYTEPAVLIDTSDVKVFEGSVTGAPVAVTVAQSTAGDSATITTTQPVKFGQKYVIQSTTAMKSVRGATLTAEGCQPGTGSDCSDLKAFTTAPFGGKLSVTDPVAGVFTFKFNNPVDPATLAPNLTNGSFKLFKQDATTKARTAVAGLSCALNSANTVVTCTATPPLYTAAAGATPSSGGNQVYIANVGILSPVAAAATTASGLPVDPNTAKFTGGGSATFVTPCP